MSVDPVTPANKVTSVSTGNLLVNIQVCLCHFHGISTTLVITSYLLFDSQEEPGLLPSQAEPVLGYQRDYLTLPTPRSHSNKEPEQTLSTAHPPRPTAMNTLVSLPFAFRVLAYLHIMQYISGCHETVSMYDG